MTQVYVKRHPSSPPEWLSIEQAGLLEERVYDRRRIRGDIFDASNLSETDDAKVMTGDERSAVGYLTISGDSLVLTLLPGAKFIINNSSDAVIAEFRDDQTLHLKNAAVVDL